MKTAGAVLIFMGFICLTISLYLRRIFRGEEADDTEVQGTVLEYRGEQKPSYEKAVVSFIINGRTIQAYADSIPVKNRPAPGSTVKLAVRPQPLAGNENNWHAHIIQEEGGTPFIQLVFYGITAIGTILSATGLIFLFL